jgi:hypothetical protein
MTTGTQSVYARLAAIAPRDLVERGGGRAAVLRAVAVPDREVVPQEPFSSGWSWRRRARVLALLRRRVTCLRSPVPHHALFAYLQDLWAVAPIGFDRTGVI